MKKVAKRVISLVLAVMMVFTSMLFGVTEDISAASITPEEVTLTNSGFDQDYWNGWSASFSDDDWTNGTYQLYKETYTNKGLTAPEGSNGYFLNVWKQSESTIWLSQKITELPAGEYTVSVPVMGSGMSVSVSLGGQTSNAKSLSGYGTWDNVTGTFTISSDMTDAYIVINLACSADAWGYLDSVNLSGKTIEQGDDEVTYAFEVLQDDEVVSEGSAAAIVGEDTTFTAKITKTDADGNTTVIDDLTGYEIYWYDKSTDVTTSNVLSYTVNKDTAGEYWYDVTFKDENGTEYKTWFGIVVTEEAIPEYGITINPSAPTGEEGEKITVTATVTVDGVSTTDLATNKLAVYWWTDDNENNGVTYDSSSSTLTNEVTLNKAGTYNFTVKLNNAEDPWNTWKTTSFTLTVEEGEVPVIDYAVAITPETTDITKGDVVKLDAKVTVDDVEVTDLEAAGLQIVWSATEEGLSDIEFDHTTLYALTTNAKLPSEGSYFVVADIVDANGEVVATTTVELIAKAPEDEVKKIDLPNDDFSEEIVENDPVWKGSTKSGNWTNNRFYRFAYSSDAWLELASYCSGAYCMKMEAVAGDELQVVQYVETLKAGTYTIVVPVMGGDGSVKVVLGDQVSEAKALQGWNNWSYVKVTFTVDEDMTDVPVGIKLVSSSSVGGWAFVDSISLYKGVPATGDDSVIWSYVILLLAGVAVTTVGMKKKRA